MILNIPFVKMHGLGNDFIIIEDHYLNNIKNLKNFVINISDRRIGVGCDQLITYAKNNASINMNIFNQDGSTAKACGNASRCLARLMFDKHGIENINIEICNKQISANYNNPQNITVNMGYADFKASWMPKSEDLWQLAEKYRIEPKEVLCVDVGNPHLIIFSKLSDKDKKIIGKNLQQHSYFPQGINVNFATIEDDIINLKVWERGAGFTLACGSGASASFAAANKLGFVENEAIVTFKLGQLKMLRLNDEIIMTGPAAYVFSGEYKYG